MLHLSVKDPSAQELRANGEAGWTHLYFESMIDECIVQVDEPQKMAHRWEHALADMISSTISLGFSTAG